VTRKIHRPASRRARLRVPDSGGAAEGEYEGQSQEVTTITATSSRSATSADSYDAYQGYCGEMIDIGGRPADVSSWDRVAAQPKNAGLTSIAS